jgi:hypothetical protein
MIRPFHLLITVTAAAALVACSDKPSSPPQTNFAPPASSAAPLPAAATPPALSTPPSMDAKANPAETARDSAATNPQEKMSKEQESKSMPMSGQAGSESSTALDAKQAPKK